MTSGVALSSQQLFFDGSEPLELDVTVANVSDVIDTYELRVLGIDSEWLEGATESLQLFPGESGNFSLLIDLPEDFPAGRHDVVVQVRSSIFPERLHISRIDLVVDGYEQIALDVSPNRIIAGGRSNFVVTALNQGNKESWVELDLDDPEGLTEVEFSPPGARVPPGRQQLFTVRLKAPRPWFGQPASRILNIGVKGLDESVTQLFNFIQKPKIGRWILSMCGLLFAVLVFGLVLSRELSTFADRVGVDRSVLQDAYASSSGAGNQGNATLEGQLLDSRSLQPVPWAQVQVYDGADLANKVRSTATDETGSFLISGLSRSGGYRVSFDKPGYLPSWYGGGRTIDVAKLVYPSGEELSVQMQGQLSAVEGNVTGPSIESSTASLLIDPQTLQLRQVNDPAVMASVEIQDGGLYQFEEVPSGRYQVRISVPGFSTKYSDFFYLDAGTTLSVPDIAIQRGNGEINGNLRMLKEGVGVPLEYAQLRLEDSKGSERYELTSGTPSLRFQVAPVEDGSARLANGENGTITVRRLNFSEGDPEAKCSIPAGAKGCEISAMHSSEQSSESLPIADEMNLEISVATLLGSPLEAVDIQVIDGLGREFLCSEDGNTRNDTVPPGGSTFDSSANSSCGFGGVAAGNAQVFVYRPNEDKSSSSIEISSGRRSKLQIRVATLEAALATIEIERSSTSSTAATKVSDTSVVVFGPYIQDQVLTRPSFTEEALTSLQIENLDWSEVPVDKQPLAVYPENADSPVCELYEPSLSCEFEQEMLDQTVNAFVMRFADNEIFSYGRPGVRDGLWTISVPTGNQATSDFSVKLISEDGSPVLVPPGQTALATVVGSDLNGDISNAKCVIPGSSDNCQVPISEVGYGLLDIAVTNVADWQPLMTQAFYNGLDSEVLVTPQLSLKQSGPGDFQFSNLPTPANYLLTVEGSESIQEHTMEIQLVEGQALEDLVVLANPTFGSIRGQLSLPTGVSGRAGGVEVIASDGESTWSSTSISAGVDDSRIGSFVFPKLPVPGTYQITVDDPLMEASAIDYVVSELAPDVVAPNPLLLKPKLGSLSGRIFQCENTSCSTKSARPKANVTLSNSLISFDVMSVDRCFLEAGVPNAGTSGCGGNFIVDSVPVGSYLLAVEVTGAQPQTRQVTIGSGTTTNVEILVPVSAQLEIEICDALPTNATARCAASNRLSGWNIALYKESEFPTGSAVPGIANANGDITTYNSLDAPLRYVVTANGPSSSGRSGNLSTSFAMPASSKVVLVCAPPALSSNLASCRLVNLG